MKKRKPGKKLNTIDVLGLTAHHSKIMFHSIEWGASYASFYHFSDTKVKNHTE